MINSHFIFHSFFFLINLHIHIFPKGIIRKVNTIERQEFEHAYFDITVQNVIHYSTRYSPPSTTSHYYHHYSNDNEIMMIKSINGVIIISQHF